MRSIEIRQMATVNKEKVASGGFSIRSIESVLAGQKMIHKLHKHDFYFVLAVQQGHGLHEIDFVKYEVGDSAIFIVRPGQVHRLELEASCTGFLMEFDLSFYQPKNPLTDHRWRKATNKNYCQIHEARFTKLLDILRDTHEELNVMENGHAEAIQAYLNLFFIHYVRQSQNPNSIAKTESIYLQERFEEFLYQLEQKIFSMKSVSQYADLLNLSAFQLNAITKASVGKTVSELINDQIVLEAKRHLLATSYQIKDIADLLGYEDISYFSRFFKKQTGHSPEAFRKNFK